MAVGLEAGWGRGGGCKPWPRKCCLWDSHYFPCAVEKTEKHDWDHTGYQAPSRMKTSQTDRSRDSHRVSYENVDERASLSHALPSSAEKLTQALLQLGVLFCFILFCFICFLRWESSKVSHIQTKPVLWELSYSLCLNVEFSILLPPPPKCWHDEEVRPCQVYVVLRVNPRVLSKLDYTLANPIAPPISFLKNKLKSFSIVM